MTCGKVKWLGAFAYVMATAAFPVSAQVLPDAGRITQELSPPREAPRRAVNIDVQAPVAAPAESGGAVVQLASVSFSGNTLFTGEVLSAVLGHLRGRTMDFSELQGLAGQITGFYRKRGYPFAYAYLPQQKLGGGQLRIAIIEGRYGEVAARGEAGLAVQAQPYLGALKPGEVIALTSLERSLLLLSDLPGVRTQPIIRPGAAAGTGDLDVDIERAARYMGDVGLDNYGNYYSGQVRGRARLSVNSPFMLGDRIDIAAVYTQENLWMGSLAYSVPLGSEGMRGYVSHTQTHYQLAHGFEGNVGLARIGSAGLGYAIVRSRMANLSVRGDLQYKRFYNSFFDGALSEKYHSVTLPLVLSFDRRDTLGGGGITYGALTWAYGDLYKDDPVREGGFNKLSLDLMRLQALPGGFTLFGRFSGQLANNNLDSSEKMFLGGPLGVRAYPLGEAGGDEGWLVQLELRYRQGSVEPYVFYDHGRVKADARPSQVAMPAADQTRAGVGAGVRVDSGLWSLNAAVAWRTNGGAPGSDTHSDPKPRLWLAAARKF